MLAAQHAALALTFMVYPLAAAQQMGLGASETTAFLSASLMAIALATGMHYLRPPLGSGSLAIEIPTPIFLPATVLAGSTGGLALITGASMLCAAVEWLFAKSLRRLRGLFPAEVCGLAVLMLGLTIAKPGILAATGAAVASAAMPGADLSPPGLVPVSVAAATLLTMVGVALFGSARARMLTLLAGLGVGVGLSALGGLIGADTSAMVDSAPIAGMPQLRLSLPHLDLSVLPLALVLGLALSIDNLGMLLGIQRQANPDWSKMDVAQAAGGIQVSAVGDLVAGILGGMPTGISSSNVGLAETTGIYARIVSAATALVLILAAFSPRLVVALSLVPRPVVGAIMVYASAHMIASGMSLIMTRLLSPQRIFTIGFSVLIGLAAVLVPGIGTALPTIWQPVINSPVAAGSLSAIVLHALFSFRIRRTARIALDAPAEPVGRRIEDFLDRQGRLWGARREVIARAKAAALEAAEIVALTGDRRILFLTVSFDQEQLLLELAHTGPAIPLPPPLGKGTHLGALDIDTAVSAAGAALLRHFTDQLDTARGAPPATPACLILGFQH